MSEAMRQRSGNLFKSEPEEEKKESDSEIHNLVDQDEVEE